MGNAKPLLPKDVVLASDIYSATAGANAVILVTEWQEFIHLNISTISTISTNSKH